MDGYTIGIRYYMPALAEIESANQSKKESKGLESAPLIKPGNALLMH